MKSKELYVAPEVEVLVVQNEGVICGSYGEPGSAGGGAGHNNGGSF